MKNHRVTVRHIAVGISTERVLFRKYSYEKTAYEISAAIVDNRYKRTRKGH